MGASRRTVAVLSLECRLGDPEPLTPPVLLPGSFPGGPRSTGRALTLGQEAEPIGPLEATLGKEIPSSWPGASQQGCQLTPSADSNSAPVAQQPVVFLAKPPPPD